MADSSVPEQTKTCCYCKKAKPKSAFEQKSVRNRWGSEMLRCVKTCRECSGLGRYHPPKTEKCCIFCDQVKAVTEFHSHNYTTRTGKPSRRLMSGCKECCSKYARVRRVEKRDEIAAQSREYRKQNYFHIIEKNKQYYAANKEKLLNWSRKHALRKNYGITLEQHAAMVAAQGGKCLICEQVPSATGKKSRLRVDHCHTTGKIRGLLCHSCNVSIGLLKDDPRRVRRLLEYLEKHQNEQVSRSGDLG